MLVHCAQDMTLVVPKWLLLGNAFAAFALNLAVYLLIGKTSALTMNIAGTPASVVLLDMRPLRGPASIDLNRPCVPSQYPAWDRITSALQLAEFALEPVRRRREGLAAHWPLGVPVLCTSDEAQPHRLRHCLPCGPLVRGC